MVIITSTVIDRVPTEGFDARQKLHSTSAMESSPLSNNSSSSQSLMEEHHTALSSKISQWIDDSHDCRLCWLQRLIPTPDAKHFAELFRRKATLAAGVYGIATNTSRLFHTIATQLTRSIPDSRPSILQAFIDEPAILARNPSRYLQASARKLILDPLISVRTLDSTIKIIFIDAYMLSTSGSQSPSIDDVVRSVLSLSQAFRIHRLPFKIFMLSGPDLHRRTQSHCPDFDKQTRSLYYRRGELLDSWMGGFEELSRLSDGNAAYDSPIQQSLQQSLSPALDPVMTKVHDWISNDRNRHVCWLKFHDSTLPRSAMTQRIADACATKGTLGASITCHGMHLNHFFATLAYQLSTSTSLQKQMQRTIEEDRTILLPFKNLGLLPDPRPSMQTIRKLLVVPFLRGNLQRTSPLIVVIDFLGWSDAEIVLESVLRLANTLHSHRLPFRFLIISGSELYGQAKRRFPKFLDQIRSLLLHRENVFDCGQVSLPSELLPLWITMMGAVKLQKVYQSLASCILSRMADSDENRTQRLWNAFQAYLDRMSAKDSISSLAESHHCRVELLRISTELQLSDHRTIREALRKDEADLAFRLQGIIESEADKKNVLSLQGEAALGFLDLLQFVLDQGLLRGPYSPAIVHKARRLLANLSVASGLLPSAVSVQGVTLLHPNPLSRGGFADIYQASYQGKEVALKRLIIRRDKDVHKVYQLFRREATLWQQLKHPFVLPFLGITSDIFQSPCMVSPWMRNGTISDLRRVNGPANINIEKRVLEIAQGLEYLHSEGIVHGDLRGANILVDEHWHACLADFGLAKFSEATNATHTSNCNGSTRWMAPELFLPEDFGLERFQKTRESDIFALACVYFEIYAGQAPFAETFLDPGVIYQVMSGKRPRRPTEDGVESVAMSDDMWNLVESCWKHNPSKRPSTSTVVRTMQTWTSDSSS